MGLGDFLVGSGAQTQAQADANYANQQAQYQAALQARIDAGTITPSQVALYNANVGGSLEDQNQGAIDAATQPFQNLWYNLTGAYSGTSSTITGMTLVVVWIGAGLAGFFFAPKAYRWAIVAAAGFLAFVSFQNSQANAQSAITNLAGLPGDTASIFSTSDNQSNG